MNDEGRLAEMLRKAPKFRIREPVGFELYGTEEATLDTEAATAWLKEQGVTNPDDLEQCIHEMRHQAEKDNPHR